MADRCEPYCGFLDLPDDPMGIAVCDECGTFWELRTITEVDIETGLPTVTQAGWINVAHV